MDTVAALLMTYGAKLVLAVLVPVIGV